MFGLFDRARANKESIIYTILTIFLLERVRRGWNRIESRGRQANLEPAQIEVKQQWFTFGAALLYALPFLLPSVKYVYRSFNELAGYVNGLAVLSSLWAFVLILFATELLLAVVIYNLLGIYVEKMNAAFGFFRKLGRSVMDGSRVAVQTGGSVGSRLVNGARYVSTQTGAHASRAARYVGARGGAMARPITAPLERPAAVLKTVVMMPVRLAIGLVRVPVRVTSRAVRPAPVGQAPPPVRETVR